MKKYDKLFVMLNFAIPLLIGTSVYYFFSPNVMFVKGIDRIVGTGWHFNLLLENNFVARFVRFHFLDMLWGYALVFALYFILDDNTAKLKDSFFVAFVFSILMESLQLTPLAKGTFDMLDILYEFLSEVFAVFIIKKFLRRN